MPMKCLANKTSWTIDITVWKIKSKSSTKSKTRFLIFSFRNHYSSKYRFFLKSSNYDDYDISTTFLRSRSLSISSYLNWFSMLEIKVFIIFLKKIFNRIVNFGHIGDINSDQVKHMQAHCICSFKENCQKRFSGQYS